MVELYYKVTKFSLFSSNKQFIEFFLFPITLFFSNGPFRKVNRIRRLNYSTLHPTLSITRTKKSFATVTPSRLLPATRLASP